MDERSARLARNEAIFHARNDRVQAVVGDQPDKAPNLSECGDPECFEHVPLANAAYGAVRSHPARFVVVPGREGVKAGQVVVEEPPHVAVVDQRGEESELVKCTEPRAGS